MDMARGSGSGHAKATAAASQAGSDRSKPTMNARGRCCGSPWSEARITLNSKEYPKSRSVASIRAMVRPPSCPTMCATFSSSSARGRRAPAILTMSRNRLPRSGSSNPSRRPAWLKGWQGKPAHSTSALASENRKSPRTSRTSAGNSPASNSPASPARKFASYAARAAWSISTASTQEPPSPAMAR